MIEATVFGVIYIAISVAGLVILFWLAITAIRAMNVYIARNRSSSTRDDPNYGARL